MYQQEYYVPKSSGTLTDALLAYGLATVLDAVGSQAPRSNPRHLFHITIEDRGVYVIKLSEPIQATWLEHADLRVVRAMPVLRVAKPKDDTKAEAKPKREKAPFPEGLRVINYNAIWEEIRKTNELIEAHRKVHGRISQQELQDLRDSYRQEPHRDVALLIGDYRMQVEGIHNQAVTQWFRTVEAGYQVANLRAILQMFATPYTDINAIAKAWAKEVKLDGVKARLTASQVFNPSMGKGQNRPKADQLVMGNTDYFWLLEFLKAQGLFAAAASRAFPDENMRKTYVLAPNHIELSEHQMIFNRFAPTLDSLGVSPIKADILTSLDYAHAYLSYCRQASIEHKEVLDLNPTNTINGFHVASYVLLSQNSFTMINLSFLGLPPWLYNIETMDDVVAVQDVIDEHRTLIRPLQEKLQEGSALLDAYRDFLTGHRLDAFFHFCTGFGEYVVRTLPNNRFLRQHSIAALDEIFRRINMSDQSTPSANDLTEFASTSNQHLGFHQIAYAIRHSTVIPQRQNARLKSNQPGSQKSLYDIRYGLGNNLRRKSDDAIEFMTALTEFVHSYNAETEQVYDNTSEDRKNNPTYGRGRYRKPIPFSALDDVLELVKRYDSRFICNMLVAYGYARAEGKGTIDQDGDTNVELEGMADDATTTAQEA
jgi:hypothetical protein